MCGNEDGFQRIDSSLLKRRVCVCVCVRMYVSLQFFFPMKITLQSMQGKGRSCCLHAGWKSMPSRLKQGEAFRNTQCTSSSWSKVKPHRLQQVRDSPIMTATGSSVLCRWQPPERILHFGGRGRAEVEDSPCLPEDFP